MQMDTLRTPFGTYDVQLPMVAVWHGMYDVTYIAKTTLSNRIIMVELMIESIDFSQGVAPAGNTKWYGSQRWIPWQPNFIQSLRFDTRREAMEWLEGQW